VPLSEMFGTFALSVGAAVSINFFRNLGYFWKIIYWVSFLEAKFEVLLFLGGDGILGEMGS
jgi:hypothetical protein